MIKQQMIYEKMIQKGKQFSHLSNVNLTIGHTAQSSTEQRYLSWLRYWRQGKQSLPALLMMLTRHPTQCH